MSGIPFSRPDIVDTVDMVATPTPTCGIQRVSTAVRDERRQRDRFLSKSHGLSSVFAVNK